MIVVADTSPINYLALIDEINLLPALYGEIIIPEAVFRELRHSNAPLAVQDFWRKIRLGSRFVEFQTSLILRLAIWTSANAKRFSWRRKSTPKPF